MYVLECFYGIGEFKRFPVQVPVNNFVSDHPRKMFYNTNKYIKSKSYVG